MTMILFLLLALANGFAGLAQPARPSQAKRKVKTVYSNHLLELATSGLAVPHLRRVYTKALHVSKISRNMHEPAVLDTLLTVTTSADRLKLLSNKYNSFLLTAEITSPTLNFGQGIRIGATKTAFCKAFGLPATYDGYQLADAEGRSSIYFLFRQGTLASVSYDIGWLD